MGFTDEVIINLREITGRHSEIRFIDETIGKLHPIAVVKENVFHLFDVSEQGTYEYIKSDSIPGIEVPEGVLAAFPLPFYGNRGSVVVGKSALETPEGNIFVFHEFVHCHQMETCEFSLKEGLQIHRDAMSEDNGMWEITHPFPYEKDEVESLLCELHCNLLEKEPACGTMEKLKNILDTADYEYMIWQMWKEGYARYVENKLRKHYGLPLNTGNIRGVYDRVIFYELGAAFAKDFMEVKKESSGIEGFYHYLNEAHIQCK